MSYDSSNIFARILRGEIPCKKVYEDEFALSFHDINPQAPVHVLVVPKGEFEDHGDFVVQASEAQIVGFERAIQKVVDIVGVREDGFRLIANTGANGGQEVAHFHVHILGGVGLGRMVSKD